MEIYIHMANRMKRFYIFNWSPRKGEKRIEERLVNEFINLAKSTNSQKIEL